MFNKDKNILIIDDDAMDRHVFSTLLKKAGWRGRILEASSVEEAFLVQKKEPIDCVILDYAMPGLDGLDYLEKHVQKGVISYPVIMLTGHGHEDVVAKAFKFGIMEYLRKSDLEEGRLYRTVLNALEAWRLRKAVEKQQKEMEDFVYAAAHDLKSPLSTIAGYIGLIREEANDAPNAKEMYDLYLSRVQAKINAMRTFIDTLLNFATVTAQEPLFEQVNMTQVLNDVLENLNTSIEENEAKIAVGTLPEFWGDATHMTQLLQNLIGNAVKYGKEKECHVSINARVHKHEYHLTISDTGIGIAPEDCKKIFTPFSRLHNTKQIKGCGLGLATCKKIVDRYKGKIWMESEVGKGSTMHVIFPQLKTFSSAKKTAS